MKSTNFFIDLNPKELGYADYAQALQHAKETYQNVTLYGLALANTFERKHFVWYGITDKKEVFAFPAFLNETKQPFDSYFFAEYQHLGPQNYFMRKGSLYFYTLTRVIIKYKVLYHEDLVTIAQKITNVSGITSLARASFEGKEYFVWQIKSENRTNYLSVFDKDKEVIFSNNFEKNAKIHTIYKGERFEYDGIVYTVDTDKDERTFIHPIE